MGYGRVIIEESPKNIGIIDAISNLIKDRIVFIDGIIDEDMANGVIAQMLYLNSQSTTKPIHVYINSYGGEVHAGLGIYDVANIIQAPIRTVCIGKACSMGAFLMLMGSERCATENSRIMLHQPSGGCIGTVKSMEIDFEEVKKSKEILYGIVKSKTNITDPEEEFRNDKWYSAEEALEVGILTSVMTKADGKF